MAAGGNDRKELHKGVGPLGESPASSRDPGLPGDPPERLIFDSPLLVKDFGDPPRKRKAGKSPAPIPLLPPFRQDTKGIL